MIGNVVAATDVNNVPWYQQLITSLTQAGTAYLTLEQQRSLMRMNEARVAQGLAPLTASEFGLGVQVGVDKSTKNTILWVAGGIGVALILTGALSGRRRS